MKCSDVQKKLEKFVPRKLAAAVGNENTGLIIGRSDKNVSTILVAYQIDLETVDYAVAAQADMILSYEPIIKEPISTIGSDTYQGRLILRLLRHDIACYAVGSSFDQCRGGMADWIAAKLELSGVSVTEPVAEYEDVDGKLCQGGFGRIGHYKKKRTLEEMVACICDEFSQEGVRVYCSKEDDGLPFSDVAVAVWASEKRLDLAMERGAQIMVTCSVRYQDAIKVCSEHRAVLELSGEVAQEIFCECMEQYLSESISSSVEILSMPTQRKCRFVKAQRKE